MKSMMTSKQAAKFLNVHINTVRRWSDQGLLKCCRVGKRKDRRFTEDDMREFLGSNHEVRN